MSWVKVNILICFCLFSCSVFSQDFRLRRICKSNTENTLFFYAFSDTCSSATYYIYARNGATGPYNLIDSVSARIDQYQHINANPGGVPTPWSYFLLYKNPCDTSLSLFSDTLQVDLSPPELTLFDSVSVDVSTNSVLLGWRRNRSADFKSYELYWDSATVIHFIAAAGQLRDTSFIDTRGYVDPKSGPISYYITTVDSCGNRRDFGNKQSTVWLQGGLDTCKRSLTLNWTSYVGWRSIRSYYLYKRVAPGTFTLVDSVTATVISYTINNILLGESADYFIRAFKDTSINVSSTSNLLNISSRPRKDPLSSLLLAVSADNPDGDQVNIVSYINPTEEGKTIFLYAAEEPSLSNFTRLSSINVLGKTGRLVNVFQTDRSKIHHYNIEITNLCGSVVKTSPIQPNLKLRVTTLSNTNLLTWNAYFGWDNGVEKYMIYRGTNIDNGPRVYHLIDSVAGLDSSYLDEHPPAEIGSNGLCYYVDAIQNPGSASGFQEKASSFSDCLISATITYIPNAFTPAGLNPLFRPEGSFIDYTRSSMEIFDRWGGRVFSKQDLTLGWDGKDRNNKYCMQGVYYYKITIIGIDGKEKLFTGLVTLLD